MKRYLAIILTLVLVISSFTGCFITDLFGPKLSINAPQEVIEAELGSFDLPKYQVVDEEGLILSEYTVIVKKVVGPDGSEVKVAYNKINAIAEGVYTITYGVEDGSVADVEVKVSFADNTAPSLDMDAAALPKFYIQGMSYNMPAYQLTDGPDYDACYAKLYYFADKNAEGEEVTVTDGVFLVDHNTGYYQILIHAEDAAGNVKEYTFNVEATGPSEIVDGKILYFDEKYGISQVKNLWNLWELSYSSEVAYGDEAGSMKVVTSAATDYIVLDKLIQSDISEYDFLTFRVYNANDYDVYTGYTWFADTVCKAREWTEVTIPVSWFESKNATNVDGKRIYADNLTGLAMRIFESYDADANTAGATFYFSAMVATKATPDDQVPADTVFKFDKPLDLSNVALYWDGCNSLAISNDVKFGDEKGSLQVIFNQAQGWNYIQLNMPNIKDISAYDYITFNVYNPKDFAFELCYCWGGNVICLPNSWTEVKWPVAVFANGGADVPATDISGMEICFYGTGIDPTTGEATEDAMVGGDCFYVSSIKVGNNAPDPVEIPDDVAMKFENEEDLGRVRPFWDCHSLSIDTEMKHGDDLGSLKVLCNTDGQGSNYVILTTPYNDGNFEEYDYISYWVYNPTNVTFSMGVAWGADTTIAPGEWTEVRISAELMNSGNVSHAGDGVCSMADVSELRIRLFDAEGLMTGDCFYISAVKAGKNEPAPEEPTIADDVAMKFENEEDLGRVRLNWDDCHTLSIDTEMKHGDDLGSLKVLCNTDGQGSNYVILTTPYNDGNFEEYDYISYWVYNPTNVTFSMGVAWGADTTIAPGEWTEVRISAELMNSGNVSHAGDGVCSMADVSELRIRLFDAEGLMTGDCFYISAVKAGMNE